MEKINGENILRLEVFLTVIWVFRSKFLLGVLQIFIYTKNMKNLQNMSFYFDLRNNAISNLCGQPKCNQVLQLD